jgi:hypothetical protein
MSRLKGLRRHLRRTLSVVREEATEERRTGVLGGFGVFGCLGSTDTVEWSERAIRNALLPDAQLLDDRPIPLDLGGFEVVEKPTSLTNHLQKPATRVVISGVNLEVLRQVLDLLRKESDLDLRRTRVRLVQSVLIDDAPLLILGQRHVRLPFCLTPWNRGS